MLEAVIQAIADKKAQLDKLRPLSQAALAQLQKPYDVELEHARLNAAPDEYLQVLGEAPPD